jgi:hypothetical protein
LLNPQYGSFGYFFDIMKYNLPQGSFGGAYWHDCVYALDSPDFTQIIPQRDSPGHYCPLGGGGTQAVGSMPNMRFIENYDYREPANDPKQIGSLGKTGLVDPGLMPMKQHVWTFGGAWQIKNNLQQRRRGTQRRQCDQRTSSHRPAEHVQDQRVPQPDRCSSTRPSGCLLVHCVIGPASKKRRPFRFTPSKVLVPRILLRNRAFVQKDLAFRIGILHNSQK